RPRPSFVSHRRPVAPDMSAEPTWPTSVPEGKSLFVKATRAVTPSAGCAASASWIAWSSGLEGGVGPPPPAATAIAAPPAASPAAAVATKRRLRVEALRRKLTAILSLVPPLLYARTLRRL